MSQASLSSPAPGAEDYISDFVLRQAYGAVVRQVARQRWMYVTPVIHRPFEILLRDHLHAVLVCKPKVYNVNSSRIRLTNVSPRGSTIDAFLRSVLFFLAQFNHEKSSINQHIYLHY